MSSVPDAPQLSGGLRAGLKRADAATFVGLVAFVAALAVVDSVAELSLSRTWLTALGMVIAFLPAVGWLAVFYRRDAVEPEPKRLVLAAALLGGLLAAAVALPAVATLFDVDAWLYRSTWTHLAGSVLVVGFVQETTKYLGLRLFFRDLPEFDEVGDGVIYGTAIGIGFATILNAVFIADSGGAQLGAAAFRIVITVIAHASLTGLLGLFVSRQKLQSRPVWWTAAGLLLVSVVNGLFLFTRSSLSTGAFSLLGRPAGQWLGLLIAAVLAGGLAWLVLRSLGSTVEDAAAAGPTVNWRSMVVALTVAVVALGGGMALRAAVLRPVVVTVQGIDVEMPAGWIISEPAVGGGVTAGNPLSALQQYTVTPAGSRGIDGRLGLLADTLVDFRVLDRTGRSSGLEQVSYAFVVRTGDRLEVAQGLDRVVDSAGGPLLISYQAIAREFDDGLDRLDGLVEGISDDA